MKIIKKIKPGFTLFELIIYIAVFGIFFTGLIGVLIYINNNNNTAVQKQLLNSYKNFLDNHIESTFLSSHIIILPSDSTSTSTNELDLASIVTGTTNVNTYYTYQLDTTQSKLYFYSGNTPIPFSLSKNSNTAGTLPAGTYYYRVVAFDSTSQPIYVSNELKIILASPSTINLTWTPSPNSGISSYRVYRGTASNSQNLFYGNGAATTFADTGSVSFSPGSPSFTSAKSSTCTDTNCKPLSIPTNMTLSNFQLSLLKNSDGVSNGVKVHLDLQSVFNSNIQMSLDTVYTL